MYIYIHTHTHTYDMSKMSERLDVPAEHSILYYLLAFSTSALQKHELGFVNTSRSDQVQGIYSCQPN